MRITAEQKETLRNQILARALASLKTGGFHGMPVDKIMKDVGLTSGALYSHFESKEDLFAQVLVTELDRLIQWHRNEIEAGGREALVAFLDRYLSPKHVGNVESGCAFVALGSDMHRLKAATRAKLEEKIEALISVLSKGISKGSEAEKLEKMRFIYASMIGTLTLCRAVKNQNLISRNLEATKSHLLELV